MKKQQLLLVGCGFLVLIALFFFGKTIPPSKPKVAENTPHRDTSVKAIDTREILEQARLKLSESQLKYVTSLENSVKRGDVKNQQISVDKQLAAFWGDTMRLWEPYAWYTAEAAKLENSEKSLTFAAHLFLSNLKTAAEPALQHWLATNAKDLFTQALQVNPANDSSKVGLGSCYLLGDISDNPMQGISMIREVVQRDPGNTFGQFMLGLGGIKSGQYDKALERFQLVLRTDPNNLEAMLNVAEVYDRKGEKKAAIEWYRKVRARINNPEAQKELDARIKTLQ